MDIEKIKRRTNGTVDVDFYRAGGISSAKGSDEQILQAHQTGQSTIHRHRHAHRQLRFADAARAVTAKQQFNIRLR